MSYKGRALMYMCCKKSCMSLLSGPRLGIFCRLLNTFGSGTAGGVVSIQQVEADLSSKINQACLYYVYLAIASAVVAYGEVCYHLRYILY